MKTVMIGSAMDDKDHEYELLDNYKGRDGKFIKGFLLNDKRNKNGWKVTWESILKYASDFINHPGIYYESGGEPDHTDGRTYKENMANQEDWRVVNIIDVMADESTHTLNYVGEIIDDDFEKLWLDGEINMTSPAVWPEDMQQVGTMPSGRPILDVTRWRALHVAYINEPAYGEDAFTLATCDGDGESCKVRLSAKASDVENKTADEIRELFANDLSPLQQIPLIRATLNNIYTPCEIKGFVKEIVASTDEDFTILKNKLNVIIEDNPEMEKDHQLAMAYAFNRKEGIEELEKLAV